MHKYCKIEVACKSKAVGKPPQQITLQQKRRTEQDGIAAMHESDEESTKVKSQRRKTKQREGNESKREGKGGW